MRNPNLFWGGSIGVLAVLDVWCHRNATTGDTLSECTRLVFRTHTPTGRAAFLGAWIGLSLWLVPHINRKVEEALS